LRIESPTESLHFVVVKTAVEFLVVYDPNNVMPVEATERREVFATATAAIQRRKPS